MGLLSRTLGLPVTAPFSGTLWIARKLTEAAEQERSDPARLRRELAALEARLLAGEISEESYDAAEYDILTRLQAAGG